MNKEKQIDEMAKDLCKHSLTEYCASGRCQNPNCLVNAKALETLCAKGYRKAEDIAREIFEEADKIFMATCLSLETYNAWCELKKKYTQDKGRDKLAEFDKYSPWSWSNTED